MASKLIKREQEKERSVIFTNFLDGGDIQMVGLLGTLSNQHFRYISIDLGRRRH